MTMLSLRAEQGMSLKELGFMCWSSMASQRTLAFETLKLLVSMEAPLTQGEMLDYLVDNSTAVTLITLLGDSNLNCSSPHFSTLAGTPCWTRLREALCPLMKSLLSHILRSPRLKA
jgi:hypothetical protein